MALPRLSVGELPLTFAAAEGLIRGRSYNIRLDDQVLLRFSPTKPESTYYFGDMIGGFFGDRSASANATPGLGRYPPFKREAVAIATTALEGFKNDAKTMVTALVDMERVFVPPQLFIRLVQRRQRREEEIKTKSSKKVVDAEQSLLNRESSPQTGGNLKSMKDTKQDKDEKEGPTLKTAGPDGEITAAMLVFELLQMDIYQLVFKLNENEKNNICLKGITHPK
ncbi:hypothetical protein L2E82_44121 [Cichorium intybus]|uniref:Uncharacterized protein n=1 Tax=Cichorium intybus TaxID=13427 RepID=A0ACB8ZQU0_CICIN|nr:hypothetical protein L2E82_44121 [Cichorium intybus]